MDRLGNLNEVYGGVNGPRHPGNPRGMEDSGGFNDYRESVDCASSIGPSYSLIRTPIKAPFFPPPVATEAAPHPPTGRKDLCRTSVGTCVMKYAVRETHSAS